MCIQLVLFSLNLHELLIIAAVFLGKFIQLCDLFLLPLDLALEAGNSLVVVFRALWFRFLFLRLLALLLLFDLRDERLPLPPGGKLLLPAAKIGDVPVL